MDLHQNTVITALNPSALAHSIAQNIDVNSSYLIIVENNQQLEALVKELAYFLPKQKEQIIPFPDLEILPYDFVTPHPALIAQRTEGLYKLIHHKKVIVITSITGLCQYTPPKEFIIDNTLMLEIGQKMNPNLFRDIMHTKGYIPVREVNEHGEYSVRGSILDIYPSGSHTAYRVELFDDEVDNIRLLDTQSHRSHRHIKSIKLLPAQHYTLEGKYSSQREIQIEKHFANTDHLILRKIIKGTKFAGLDAYLACMHTHLNQLTDYMPDGFKTIIPINLKELINRTLIFQEQRQKSLVKKGFPALNPEKLYSKEPLKKKAFTSATYFQIKPACESYNSVYAAETKHRSDWIKEAIGYYLNAGTKCIITSINASRLKNLQTFFSENGLEIESNEHIKLSTAPIQYGFVDKKDKIAYITESEILGRKINWEDKKHKTSTSSPIDHWQVGSLFVHRDYGVGKFHAFETMGHQGKPQDYLVMHFRDNDKLFVSTNQLHLLSLYRGKATEQVELDKLGSKKWAQKKKQAKRVAEDFAEKLLAQHSQRKSAKAPKMQFDAIDYAHFISNFPYETTPDQQKAIDQVIKDIQQDKGMDRLICGDVGFGKTEVALRAAFCTILSGFQVALLCPTTILCEQHTRTFQERMQNWPINLTSLSRLQKTQQQQKLEDLSTGKIDCIIGTHALLSPNIQFHKLGLLIVDEEHKFGVKQKELLQALRGHAHILSLSATPIPRTLNMALANIRDMSIIATPPKNRIAVQTQLLQYDTNVIVEALMREKQRGGQAYYMHNDIKALPAIEEKIKKLCPDITTAIISGQTGKKTIDNTMQAFNQQQFDVLIATSIIESGIDIPNANTIIIHRADLLGLSQIHQLRGRVGRSQHQAFAYLFIPPENCLTSEGKARMATIKKQAELGSGLNIALEDLEIRGAGDILGKKQSGHMADVGLTLYSEMLQKAIGRKTDTIDYTDETEMESITDISIPHNMVNNIEEKLDIYRKIRFSRTDIDIDNIQKDLEDNYGVLPKSVENLLIHRKLQLHLSQQRITKWQMKNLHIEIQLNEKNRVDIPRLIENAQKRWNTRILLNNRIVFTPKNHIDHKDYRKLRDLFIF